MAEGDCAVTKKLFLQNFLTDVQLKRTGGGEVEERNKLTREEGRTEIRKEITRRKA